MEHHDPTGEGKALSRPVQPTDAGGTLPLSIDEQFSSISPLSTLHRPRERSEHPEKAARYSGYSEGAPPRPSHPSIRPQQPNGARGVAASGTGDFLPNQGLTAMVEQRRAHHLPGQAISICMRE